MEKNLTGRNAVITGGSRGLGEAMAKALAAAGASIALVASDNRRMEQVRDDIVARGGAAGVFVADVRRESEVARTADAIGERFGNPRERISARTWWIIHCRSFGA